MYGQLQYESVHINKKWPGFMHISILTTVTAMTFVSVHTLCIECAEFFSMLTSLAFSVTVRQQGLPLITLVLHSCQRVAALLSLRDTFPVTLLFLVLPKIISHVCTLCSLNGDSTV